MTERVRHGWMAMNTRTGLLAPHYGVEWRKRDMQQAFAGYAHLSFKPVKVRIEVVPRKKRPAPGPRDSHG